MYIQIIRDKLVQVVGPFGSMEEFLAWAAEEKVRGKFEVLSKLEVVHSVGEITC